MSSPTKKGPDPELEALVRLPEDEIDTSEIAEVTDWRGAVVGRFYRPVKEPVTLRLDADIIARLKSEGPGYQTRINALLRRVLVRRVGDGGMPTQASVEADAREGAGAPASAPPNFRFPKLEEHHELEGSFHLTDLIRRRGSVFAPTA
jgi:uncharacterized protein (DUF4415 family)